MAQRRSRSRSGRCRALRRYISSHNQRTVYPCGPNVMRTSRAQSE
ncbi:hypothetical protein RSAG8_02019, partial [Rhizoctonia solani AG-8 WAC10335]